MISGGIEVYKFAQISLILEAKLGDDSLAKKIVITIFRLQI